MTLDLKWSEAKLAALPTAGNFRLRGTQMNRLETFTDAAFAFSVTLIVISVNDLPQSYEEFVEALKFIPAFLVCFVQLMLFWWAHHVWSRRFGLEDGWSIVLSLALVATVLIYIFPLRLVFSAFFASATGGFLPMPFYLNLTQLGQLFVVFGSGFGLMSFIIVALNIVAISHRHALMLSPTEVHDTRWDVFTWSVIGTVGFASMITAIVTDYSPIAGYVYWSLAVISPGLNYLRKRLAPI